MDILAKLLEIEERDNIIIPPHFKLSHNIGTTGKSMAQVKIDFYNAQSCKIYSFYRPLSKIINNSKVTTNE